MLTKQEVERTRSLVVRELDDYGDIAGLRKLSDQAAQAIDLDAKNERLKAELAEYAETFSEQNKALSDNIVANERLKADIAERDVCRIADNLVEMERINRMGDMADEIKRLKAKLDAVRELAGDIVWSTLGLPGYWANSIYIKSLKMLGIIDEDGDE